MQPIRRYAGLLDASIIFSDILVVPQAMGLEVQMLDKQGPHFPDPVRTAEKAMELANKEVDVKKELSYVYEAITLTRHTLEGKVPLIGFSGAPWTLLAYMVEGGGSRIFRFVKTFIYQNKKEALALLDRTTTVCIDYLAQQVVAGAQILQIFDSWAGELSQADFAVFSLPFLKRIAQELPKKLEALGVEVVPLIVFAKGAWWALEELAESGYSVVGLDWTHDPQQARRRVAGKVSVQGNLDPNVLYGGKDVITKYVKDMMESFGAGEEGRKKYIVNLGHGMYTPQWVNKNTNDV
jgi:uroporphyrinogen decarboxylase